MTNIRDILLFFALSQAMPATLPRRGPQQAPPSSPPPQSPPPASPPPAVQPKPGWGMPGSYWRGSSSGYAYQKGRLKAHEQYEYRMLGLGWFLYWWRRLFGWIVLVFLLVGFYYAFFVNVDLGEAVITRAEVAWEQSRVREWLAPVTKYFSITKLEKEVAGIGDFQTRPGYRVPEVRGVDISWLPHEEFYTGDPIFLEAEVSADALPEEDSIVSFGCVLMDENVTVQPGVAQVEGEEEAVLRIPRRDATEEDKPEQAFVSCQFPGIPFLKKDFHNYVAYLTWTYSFETETVLRAYTQEYIIQASLRKRDVDPLRAVRDTEFLDDGFAQAQCVEGCGLADLGMGIHSKMPLSEKGTSRLTTKLFESSTVKGELQKVRRLQVLFPEEVKIGEEGCFWVGRGQTLQPVDSRQILVDESNMVLRQINAELTTEKEPVIEFKCHLAVQAGTQEIPASATILARASYDFGGKEPTVVPVKRREVVEA